MEINNVWYTLLQLYGEMDNGSGTTEVAGDNLAVVEKIEKELQKPNPDWGQVTKDLDQLETICNGMVDIAKQNHLHPASDPNFIQLLEKTAKDIDQLKKEVGMPGFSLNSLLDDFTCIKHDILQG